MLTAPPLDLTFAARSTPGRAPRLCRATPIGEARLEMTTTGLRLVRYSGDASRRAIVVAAPLGERRLLLFEIGGPRQSAAPPHIAYRVVRAYDVAPPRAPRALALEELILHVTTADLDLVGDLALDGEDWSVEPSPRADLAALRRLLEETGVVSE